MKSSRPFDFHLPNCENELKIENNHKLAKKYKKTFQFGALCRSNGVKYLFSSQKEKDEISFCICANLLATGIDAWSELINSLICFVSKQKLLKGRLHLVTTNALIENILKHWPISLVQKQLHWFFFKKMGQTRPLFSLFSFFFTTQGQI